jgi:hypothetical protein
MTSKYPSVRVNSASTASERGSPPQADHSALGGWGGDVSPFKKDEAHDTQNNKSQ